MKNFISKKLLSMTFLMFFYASIVFSSLYPMETEKQLNELESKITGFAKYDAKEIEDFLNELTKIPLSDEIINKEGGIGSLETILSMLSLKSIRNTKSLSEILDSFITQDKNNWFKNNSHYKNIFLNYIIRRFNPAKEMLPFYEKSNLFNILSDTNKEIIFNKLEEFLKDFASYEKYKESIPDVLKEVKQYDKNGQFTPYENFLKFKINLNNCSGSAEQQKQQILEEIKKNNIDLSNDTIKNLIKTLIKEKCSNTLLNNFDVWTKNVTKTTEKTSAISHDNLSNFAQALKDITTTVIHKKAVTESDEIFLGPWIEEHYPKRLIKVDEKYNKTHNNKLYQLRVFQQDKAECALHALRNALYLVDIIRSKPYDLEFNLIYQKMDNKERYEKFIEGTECTRNKGVGEETINAIKEKIKSDKITCIPECIPEKSKEYLKYIEYFTYYHPPEKYVNFPAHSEEKKEDEKNTQDSLKKQNAFQEKISKKISKIEPSLSNTKQLIVDISLFFPYKLESLTKLTNAVRNFCKESTALLVWFVGLLFSSELQTGQHAVVFVEHKHNNNIEYIYADSNNFPLGKNLGITKTIDRIISLTNNVDYFNDVLVRFIYYELIYQLDIYLTKHKKKDDGKGLERAYNKLAKLDLLKNKLYLNTYKKAFLKLTKELIEKFKFGKQEYYITMLKNFK